MAGYKGVLMLKNQPMQGMIEMRPSMRKFEANEYDLGIIRCATYSVAYLNRQVIMLLSCLKVPDQLFMDKLQSAMKLLNKERAHKVLLR